MEIQPIAVIHTDFKEKFGIPRQAGLVNGLVSEIVFEEKYRNVHALKGLDGYTHLWLIWQFSKAVRKDWSPTVKPPRLGGNEHMGVFATRSPFRPNSLGLSSVRIERIELDTPEGPRIYVTGADMLDGTPIYDIKPYLPYTDCHPDASGGFTEKIDQKKLTVEFPEKWLLMIPKEKQAAAIEVLENDPRPAYQDDPNRRYGLAFAGVDIRFYVEENRLRVCEVVERNNQMAEEMIQRNVNVCDHGNRD